MKKNNLLFFTLLLIGFLFSAQVTLAGNLKSILVIADDYPNPSMNTISASIQKDYEHITYLFSLLKKENVIDVDQAVLLKGREVTIDNVKNAITNIKVGSDDVLFFFFSGHGGMTGGKTFLALCDENFLFRSDLENMIQKKEARLRIIITDSCSSSIEGLPGARSMNVRTKQGIENLKILFNYYKGLFHITAASEGEYGWSNDKEGGWFVNAIIQKILIQNPPETWQEVAELTTRITNEKFSDNYPSFTKEWKGDMQQRGISGQHPKAYSLPTRIERETGSVKPVVESETKISSPNGLKASQGKYPDKIKLKWNKVSGASGYILLRWYNGLSDWEELGTISNNQFTDNNVKDGVTYAYVVAAYNEKNYSSYCEYVVGWTGLPKANTKGKENKGKEDIW